MEFSVPEDLEGAEVFVPMFRRNLDDVALETAEQVAVEGNAWNTKLLDQLARFVVVGDEDGNLPVVDEAELFSNGGELKMEGKSAVVFPTEALGRDDAFGVPATFLLVVVEVEVVVDGLLLEEVGMELDEAARDLGGFPEIGFTFLVFGDEDMGLAGLGEFAVAVAAPGSLGDRVESGEGAIDDGEIDIDSGFDELGGDEANGELFLQTLADLGEDAGAVFRTHEGGEVVISLALAEETEDFASMLAAVDDAESLRLIEQSLDEVGVWEFAEEVNVNPLEGGEECARVTDDFPTVFQANGKFIRVMMDRGLGGGAEDGGGVVVVGELTEDAKAG